MAEGDDEADELIDDALFTNGFEEDVEEVDEEPVHIWAFEADDVELDDEELDEPAAWLLAVACNAANMEADERFWTLAVCGCGGGSWFM